MRHVQVRGLRSNVVAVMFLLLQISYFSISRRDRSVVTNYCPSMLKPYPQFALGPPVDRVGSAVKIVL